MRALPEVSPGLVSSLQQSLAERLDLHSRRTDLRSDRGRTRSQNSRHLFGRQSFQVAQDNRRPFFFRQRGERAAQDRLLLRNQRRRFRVVWADRFHDLARLDFGFERNLIATAFASQVAADVDGDAVEPAGEILRRVESVQMFVYSQESFLRRIARVFRVAEHSPSQRNHPPLAPDDDLIEGGVVARFGAQDQPDHRIVVGFINQSYFVSHQRDFHRFARHFRCPPRLLDYNYSARFLNVEKNFRRQKISISTASGSERGLRQPA